MTDRPIPFSAPMILALLDGRKTQTRRVLKDAPEGEWFVDPNPRGEGLAWVAPEGAPSIPIRTSYACGDRLWVREAWRTGCAYDDLNPSEMGGEEQVLYEADGTAIRWTRGSSEPGRYRNGRFMPRWASRLTLTVTDVRVQRVQEISEADAKAEGCKAGFRSDAIAASAGDPSYQDGFQNLWDSLNAKRGFGWSENPWVAAYTFEVHRQNIDQMDT